MIRKTTETQTGFDHDPYFSYGPIEPIKFEDRSQKSNDQRSYGLLKGFLFFIPGAVILSFVGVAAAIIYIDIFIKDRSWETLPDTMAEQVLLLTGLAVVGTLMTWFGLGDIKRRRHALIPATVFGVGLFIGGFLSAFSSLIERFDNYFIYAIPLVLVAAVLAKSFADKLDKDEAAKG